MTTRSCGEIVTVHTLAALRTAMSASKHVRLDATVIIPPGESLVSPAAKGQYTAWHEATE